jgi:hypothetical protein
LVARCCAAARVSVSLSNAVPRTAMPTCVVCAVLPGFTLRYRSNVAFSTKKKKPKSSFAPHAATQHNKQQRVNRTAKWQRIDEPFAASHCTSGRYRFRCCRHHQHASVKIDRNIQISERRARRPVDDLDVMAIEFGIDVYFCWGWHIHFELNHLRFSWVWLSSETANFVNTIQPAKTDSSRRALAASEATVICFRQRTLEG